MLHFAARWVLQSVCHGLYNEQHAVWVCALWRSDNTDGDTSQYSLSTAYRRDKHSKETATEKSSALDFSAGLVNVRGFARKYAKDRRVGELPSVLALQQVQLSRRHGAEMDLSVWWITRVSGQTLPISFPIRPLGTDWCTCGLGHPVSSVCCHIKALVYILRSKTFFWEWSVL
jgi:hypothetical protein